MNNIKSPKNDEYTLVFYESYSRPITQTFAFPSLDSAINYCVKQCFNRILYDPKYSSSYPEGFKIIKNKKIVAYYTRRSGHPDYIETGSKRVKFPYGSAFKIAITWLDERKNPKYSKEVYKTIREARAGAYALIKTLRAKHPNAYTVEVSIYSMTMFAGKLTEIGSVVYDSNYDYGELNGGIMWCPFDVGESYYVRGVNRLGGITNEVYRTT